MRPPTADEIELAKTITADQLRTACRINRPHGLHKRNPGRPRKDGQPTHRTAAALEHERQAAAAAVAMATNHAQAAAKAQIDKNAFIPDTIDERIKTLELATTNKCACMFLRTFAEHGYHAASVKCGATPIMILGWRNNEDFRRIYEEIQQARDAATVARTCGTLADLANGEYKPKPDCLPPDTRAASLLLPALDSRFRAGQQGGSQQVQINISI